jgi:iron(III) transport system ATP-binding protein
VLVRPEELTLSPLGGDDRPVADGAPAATGPGEGITAVVVGISYTGHDAMLTLLAGDLRLEARVTAAELLPVGSRVTVRVTGRVLAYSARA